jgi:hypothetical protein
MGEVPPTLKVGGEVIVKAGFSSFPGKITQIRTRENLEYRVVYATLPPELSYLEESDRAVGEWYAAERCSPWRRRKAAGVEKK